jgi:large subunit ribosomal protein L7/L12
MAIQEPERFSLHRLDAIARGQAEGEDNMPTLSKDEILDAISNMTLLEVSELVKAMEEKFGVTAAAPVAMAAAPAGGAGGAQEEEKTEFDIVLKSFDETKKIAVIKEVRVVTGLGLKEAKDVVEAGGKTIKEGVSKEDAKKIKAQLEAAGGVVEIK